MDACAVLEVVGEGQVALEKVAIEGQLMDLFSEVTLTQTYRNAEAVNIEAVYTFPLPLDAVLLELTVKLGDRTLRGVISERQEATQIYEEAITDGNRAVLLEQVSPGLYTLNVGNIQPGEVAVINVRYGQLQRWTGDTLRFVLPTTIAPRYGDHAAAGLAPHQTPEHSLLYDLHYTLRLTIDGALATSLIESPTHPVTLRRDTGSVYVELAKGASLDRDFVLTLRAEGAACTSARSEPDGDRYVVLATFNPRFNLTEDATPRSVKIVIDCSGSMAGDAIAQAREALLRILDSLRPQDLFNIVTFGSRHRMLFGEQHPANEDNLQRARTYASALDANMGGTEVAGALAAAFMVSVEGDLPQDVLLVTDGEVWNTDDIIRNATASSHRIFTVGVGSAVSEELVQQLAEQTGGACELVTPTENMAERIHRHFRRMFAPRAQRVDVHWPGSVELIHPRRVDTVYDGDTLHLFAWTDDRLEGDVSLEVTLPDGRVLNQRATVAPATLDVEGITEQPSTLARMGVAMRLRECTDVEEGARLAVAYQLISPWTACTVVDVRPEHEQATNLPELRKVPQMLAAGWGGSSSVLLESTQPSICMLADIESSNFYSKSNIGITIDNNVPEYLEVPAFLRRGASDDSSANTGAQTPMQLVEWMNENLATIDDLDSIATLDSLIALGLPESIVEFMRDLKELDEDERAVIVALLVFTSCLRMDMNLSRTARRVVDKVLKIVRPSKAIQHAINALMGHSTPREWILDRSS